jgi:hypothetical protein
MYISEEEKQAEYAEQNRGAKLAPLSTLYIFHPFAIDAGKT